MSFLSKALPATFFTLYKSLFEKRLRHLPQSIFLSHIFMGYTPLGSYEPETEYTHVRRRSSWLINLGLFLLTVACTMMAGTQWVGHNPLEIINWSYGVQYSVLILLFLGSHEFGHYFAARAHGVDATLPYFIPIPPIGMPFGTMGAVIRTRSPIMTRKALFDIGVAGPLAGFVMCVAFLIIGFATLPPKEFIFSIHPEYRMLGSEIPATGMFFGDTVLYHALSSLFANPNGWLPPMNEMYHYPYLCVGWFGLFVTALNLLPVGQLDGGHIAYAMFGERQITIGRIAWWVIFVLGLGSLMNWALDALMYDSPDALFTGLKSLLFPLLSVIQRAAPWLYAAYGGWLLWAFLLRVFIRIEHPPIDDHEPLGVGRMALGWLAAAILVVSFSFNGIYEIERVESPRKRKGGSVVQQQQAQPFIHDRQSSRTASEHSTSLLAH